MFNKINISNKVTLLVFAVVSISILAISFTTYVLVEKSFTSRYLINLEAITKLKKDKIESLLTQHQAEIHLLEKEMNNFYQTVIKSDEKTRDESDSVEAFSKLESTLQNVKGLLNVFLLDHQGKVLLAGKQDQQYRKGSYFDDPDGQMLKSVANAAYYSDVIERDGHHYMFYGKVFSGDNSRIFMVEIHADPYLQIASDTTGLQSTGETILGKLHKNKVVYFSPLRHVSNKRSINLEDTKQVAMQQAVTHEAGATFDQDYRGEKTLAAWNYIPALKWGIVTKADRKEVFAEANELIRSFTIAGIIITVISLMISLIFSRFLINPLLSLKNTLSLLSQGILPDKVEKTSRDEIGEMAITTEALVNSLKRTANFAYAIGEGSFDTDFKPLSAEDALGTSLINMKDSIQESEKRDRERNWIVTGVAEIGEILRSHNNIEELGDEVIAYVAQKINAIQGAFYVVNDEDKDNAFIEMRSSRAYNKKKHLKARFKFAEGLVGQSAVEQDTVFRTEIPYDYVTVTSGLLGDQRPETLLIVPLITNEQVYGVLEFAGFEKFSSRDVKFVEEISLITARTVFNIKVNERTRKLLNESQEMSNELQEQQEVLRQNAEEMQATQEELKRTNQQLEEQFDEVERTQKRMASLLENASEVITIYEDNGKIRYISPSVEKIFGYKQEDMIAKSDAQHIQGEGIMVFDGMFKTLLEHPDEHVTVQYLYKTKHQGEVWVEATGTNLLTDPAVRGIILNSRDITERKRAEQEERMRGKMQALSENSLDLITRIDQEGTLFYINPTIETYTGKTPDHFLRKNLAEADLNPSVVSEWLRILDEVKTTHKKVAAEMEFPTVDDKRIVHVNAIPEFDEEEKLESVLVVSHDITERKMIEIEIESKNRKINDSINYAKRIQGAILPDTHIIQHVLPQSFILYKARDVVSGDFPWFVQKGDDIFIAAVDCTGHGVPGALISLIGYFILNDIVKSRGVSDPGEILDLLDDGVTQTLRQDNEDSKTKDGMDISLCRINKDKKELRYAGAHRPLYYMNQGEMNEIKGDRFPIGGGKYKNQTNFATHTIKFKKGDSVYFCSDGFPDQFGGPEVRKFGPKRLRDTIQENHHLPMNEVHDIISSAWHEWMGDVKQIDDVLMIGIKF